MVHSISTLEAESQAATDRNNGFEENDSKSRSRLFRNALDDGVHCVVESEAPQDDRAPFDRIAYVFRTERGKRNYGINRGNYQAHQNLIGKELLPVPRDFDGKRLGNGARLPSNANVHRWSGQ
jgi:hypothetical protein